MDVTVTLPWAWCEDIINDLDANIEYLRGKLDMPFMLDGDVEVELTNIRNGSTYTMRVYDILVRITIYEKIKQIFQAEMSKPQYDGYAMH